MSENFPDQQQLSHEDSGDGQPNPSGHEALIELGAEVQRINSGLVAMVEAGAAKSGDNVHDPYTLTTVVLSARTNETPEVSVLVMPHDQATGEGSRLDPVTRPVDGLVSETYPLPSDVVDSGRKNQQTITFRDNQVTILTKHADRTGRRGAPEIEPSADTVVIDILDLASGMLKRMYGPFRATFAHSEEQLMEERELPITDAFPSESGVLDALTEQSRVVAQMVDKGSYDLWSGQVVY